MFVSTAINRRGLRSCRRGDHPATVRRRPDASPLPPARRIRQPEGALTAAPLRQHELQAALDEGTHGRAFAERDSLSFLQQRAGDFERGFHMVRHSDAIWVPISNGVGVRRSPIRSQAATAARSLFAARSHFPSGTDCLSDRISGTTHGNELTVIRLLARGEGPAVRCRTAARIFPNTPISMCSAAVTRLEPDARADQNRTRNGRPARKPEDEYVETKNARTYEESAQ